MVWNTSARPSRLPPTSKLKRTGTKSTNARCGRKTSAGPWTIPIAQNIALAGPEIAAGMYRFLHHHRRDVPRPRVQAPDDVMRSLAEGFAASTLERVPDQVATGLDVATRLMPENGPEAAAKIRKFATDIVVLKEHGLSDQDIRDVMFGD
jgi:hypothetical protein